MTASATFSIFRAGLLLCLALLVSGVAICAGPIPAANNGVANSPVPAGRPGMGESPVMSQRADELRAREESDRLILYVSGAFAACGFLVLIFAAILHWTVVNRLAGAVDQLRAGAAPRVIETQFSPSLEPIITRLDLIIGRLDHLAVPAKSLAPPPSVSIPDLAPNNPTVKPADSPRPIVLPSAPAIPDEAEKIVLFIGKGRSLLALDQPGNALECFEKALTVDAKNADAWVNKGSALEQMQKWNDAVEAYDRAIALDCELTIAYLRKGAVFNRLQRHEAALECYERALATQEKSAPPR